MPPRSERARIISSVRLRVWGASARQLEWLAAKGRVPCSTISQKPLSERWLTSTIMCIRSISARNSKPFPVRPFSVWGTSTPPGFRCGLASSFSWFHVRVIMRTPSSYIRRSTPALPLQQAPSSMVSIPLIFPAAAFRRMSAAVYTGAIFSGYAAMMRLNWSISSSAVTSGSAPGVLSPRLTNAAKHCSR